MPVFAIGDIHGNLLALQALLSAHDFSDADTVVFLGDYVDKGPDVAGTLELLSNLSKQENYIFLRGNHDQMLVHAGIRPHLSPEEDHRDYLHWQTLSLATAHLSGKTVICGHSSQATGRIADLGHTICIDTGITKGKFLTCLNFDDYSFAQATQEGSIFERKLERT